MPLIIKKKPVDYAALESDTYIARCVGVAMVGTQMHENAKTKVPSYKRDIVLLFEVCGHHRKHKNGDPYKIKLNGVEINEPQTVRIQVTESLSQNSNLTKYIKTWMHATDDDLAEFDLELCVGKPCLLSVEKKVSETTGNEYNSIQTVSSMIAGMDAPAAILPTFAYNVDEHDEEQFSLMPEWLREIVQKSSEWEATHANTQTIDASAGKINQPAAGGPSF